MPDKLSTPIEFLKGVGPKRAELLRTELRISTYGDLLVHFPFRYVDKSRVHKVSEIVTDAVYVQLLGRLKNVKETGSGRARRLSAVLEDESGQIELVWFKGIQWILQNLTPGKSYLLYGKPTRYKGRYNMAHPEMELVESGRMAAGSSLKPVYSSTEKLGGRGLNSVGIEKIVKTLLQELGKDIPETLPSWLLAQFRFPPRLEAYAIIHNPPNAELLEKARYRFKFEELFFLQLLLLRQKLMQTVKTRGVVFEKVGDYFHTFYEQHLPFELTGAQKRVLKEIRRDVMTGYHMNRLIQGDVGSGKTIVALLSALIAIDNGFQACLMAPTEILANQHYQGIVELLGSLPLRVGLLTGSTKTAERKRLHADLESGVLHLLIGTHALIEPVVQFQNLGLAIIDEQHRFGVEQRAKLWRKSAVPPHVLVMTATPIPRTLAMTLYGDLDDSIIDELPPGRKAIKTIHRTDAARARIFGFMEEEIRKGRQIYVVYPLIQESEAFDYKDLMDGYESLVRRFPLPDYRLSIVHGQMKAEDKDYEMELFVSGKTQIMVATTVIEVGVNVPNASVMIIESAERFGLSQLHQLRGRVGRGADQSYCVLMSGYKLSNEAKKRLETMVSTTDGFEVAEVDLQLRGPGDLMGTQQSGLLDLKIADLAKDQQILFQARTLAKEIYARDENLSAAENRLLRMGLENLLRIKADWGKIS